MVPATPHPQTLRKSAAFNTTTPSPIDSQVPLTTAPLRIQSSDGQGK